MQRQKKYSTQSAQSLMEYSLILGVIVLIVFSMSPMLKRGSQGMIKLVADQIGNQQNSDQTFDDSGHLDSARTDTNTLAQTRLREDAGATTYGYDQTTQTKSSQVLNLGFTEGD